MLRRWSLRSLWVVVAVSFVALGATPSFGASTAAPKYDTSGTLRLSMSTLPGKWAPADATSDPVSFQDLSPIYDNLFQLNKSLQAAPGLVASWTQPADHMSITLKLRTDVTFHDGSTFDASTVVANFDYERAKKNSLGVPVFSLISSYSAPTSSTVLINFTQAYTDFPRQAALKEVVGAMASPKSLATPAGVAALSTVPQGSGPYVLNHASQDTRFFDKAPSYWDKAYFDKAPAHISITGIPDDNARIAAIQAGQYDVVSQSSPIPNVDSIISKTVKLNAMSGVGSGRIIFSAINPVKTPAFNDPKFRKAVYESIDFNAIQKTVCAASCFVTGQPFAKGTPGYDPSIKVPKYNPDDAKKILTAGGWEGTTLTGDPTTTTLHQSLATALQGFLQKVGLNLTLTTINTSDTNPAGASGKYDFTFNQSAAAPDNLALVAGYWLKGPINAFWTDPGVQPLYTAAQATAPGSKAYDTALQKISKYISQNPSTIVWAIWPVQMLSGPKAIGVTDQLWTRMAGIFDTRHLFLVK